MWISLSSVHSPLWSDFNPTHICVWFVVEKSGNDTEFSPSTRWFLVSIIPPVLYIHNSLMYFHPNPLLEPLLQPINRRRLKRRWPLDVQGNCGDIAGWIPYHVIAIHGIVAYWYKHQISLQIVLFLIANKNKCIKMCIYIYIYIYIYMLQSIQQGLGVFLPSRSVAKRVQCTYYKPGHTH